MLGFTPMEANYIHICPSMNCGDYGLLACLMESCSRLNVVLFLNTTILSDRLNILQTQKQHKIKTVARLRGLYFPKTISNLTDILVS